MILVGLLLGLVGVDVNSGGSRMSFGSVYLYDGNSIIVLSVAFYAIAEIMTNLEEPDEKRLVLDRRIRLRSMTGELKKNNAPSLRGTVLIVWWRNVVGTGCVGRLRNILGASMARGAHRVPGGGSDAVPSSTSPHHPGGPSGDRPLDTSPPACWPSASA